MPAWSPADARRKYGLALSDAERTRIETNMAPQLRAGGLFDADAVFEGGGVLGLAFLGAARCCDDLGIRWHALAGTSAGGITAALLAADLHIDQLEQAVGMTDFADFLSRRTSRFFLTGDPADDLQHPVLLLSNLALVGQVGVYDPAPFREWLDGLLKWAGKQSFGEVWDKSRVANDRQLKVVVSDLSRGEMRVLPDDLEPPKPRSEYRPPLTARQRAFGVAEAVRLSMSIPYFFVPGQLDTPDGPAVIVDGGILSNFPLWLYDEIVPTKPPAWPTFGFRLVDHSEAPAAIDGVVGLTAAMLRAMMLAGDRRYLSQRNYGRVVELDLTGLNLTATSFSLTNDQKDALYVRGYQGAKKFFLEQWSWPRHLEARGFPVGG